MDLETAYGGKTKSIEVIEDLLPIYDINIELKIDAKIKSSTLQPQGKAISLKSGRRHPKTHPRKTSLPSND